MRKRHATVIIIALLALVTTAAYLLYPRQQTSKGKYNIYVRNELQLSPEEVLVKQTSIPAGESTEVLFEDYDDLFIGFRTDANNHEFREYRTKKYIQVSLHDGKFLFGSVFGMGMKITPSILKNIFQVDPPPDTLHLNITNHSERLVNILIYTKNS